MRFEVLIEECDHDIRTGHPERAAKRLADLNTSRVPAPWRLPLARICRRAGRYSTGLKLLSKVMDRKPAEAPSPAEVAEYCALLVRIGAISEGLERLALVDTDAAPEALLYRAYACFSLWRYRDAIVALKLYLQSSLRDYPRLVGLTNLGYAYAGIREHALAQQTLTENIHLTAEGGHHHLERTNYALRAQVRLQLADYAGAREDLKHARELSGAAETNDGFLAVQWQLVLDALESGSLAPLEELRARALARQNWEAYRECDFYSLKITPNREKFVHLYFGTPFAEFRGIIERELGPAPSQPIYVLGKKRDPRLDLRTGEIDGRSALAFGGKLQRVFVALLRDFYQQSRVPGLFSELFPGEYFDINSSPSRVHQVIRRARKWLEDEKIPVAIVENGGFYSLQIVGAFSFRVPLLYDHLDAVSQRFAKLEERFAERDSFLAREAQDLLSLSKTMTHELLKWGVDQGKLEKSGATPRSTHYKFNRVLKKSA